MAGASRRHLIAVIEQLQADAGDEIQQTPGAMSVAYWSREEFSPHPLIVLVLAGAGLWLWGYLLVRTVRSNARSVKHFERERAAIAERYRRQVEKQAGSGVEEPAETN